MSINALSQASSIWSRATTALSPTPDASGLDAAKPNEAGSTGSSTATTAAGQPSSVGSSPFEQLASDLQAVLLQMQSGQDGAASADPTQSTTATPTAPGAQSATPSAAPAHHHHHHAGGAGPASATAQTNPADPTSTTYSSDITSLLAVA